MIQDYIENNYSDYIKQLYIYENKDSLILSAIVLNKDNREAGIGTKIMNDIITYADKTDKIIVLTPSSDYGGSKQRLIKFYQKFGFVWNRGPNKDFRFRDSMIRYPKTMSENNIKESFEEYSNDALADMIVNLSRYEGNEEAIQRVKKELNKRKGITEVDHFKGGLADDLTPKDIADKHGVPLKQIQTQIDKGVKVELEHTNSKDKAKEIAMDHLYEDPKYYDALDDMENKRKKEMGENYSIIKKLLREQVDLTVTDETPETISVLVQYNNRNAGIITVAPSPKQKDMLEIIDMKFRKDYEEPHIMRDALNGLWSIFSDINSIIIAPEKESIAFWNRMGFDRISPNYLIANRGH